MKKLILLFYMALLTTPSQSQTWEEWWKQQETQQKYLIEQIAILKVYKEALQDGYEIVSHGLELAHSFQNGDFNQHQAYFNSFSSINPQLKNHPESKKVLIYYSKVQQLISQIPKRLFQHNHLLNQEGKIILHVLKEIQKDADQSLFNLIQLLEQDQFELSDSDRLQQIKQTQTQMQEIHGYTLSFFQSCQMLNLWRAQEIKNLSQSKQFHPLELKPNH